MRWSRPACSSGGATARIRRATNMSRPHAPALRGCRPLRAEAERARCGRRKTEGAMNIANAPVVADAIPVEAPAVVQATPAAAPRTRLLLQGPIVGTLLRLAAPNVLVMLAQASTGLIETYFVSRLGTDALAGMA